MSCPRVNDYCGSYAVNKVILLAMLNRDGRRDPKEV
jgi:hypothetical protein